MTITSKERVRAATDPRADGPPEPDLTARAFQLADEFTFELLQSECVAHDEHRLVLGLCNEVGIEVSSMAEASEAIREAFDWLQLRGYVESMTDACGECIVVRRRPGEDEDPESETC